MEMALLVYALSCNLLKEKHSRPVLDSKIFLFV